MLDMHSKQDIDPTETREWLEALEGVLAQEGPERAQFLLEALISKARQSGTHLPFKLTTAYINTIHKTEQIACPGNLELERRIRAIIRWNAMAMVLRAGKKGEDLGGHIASYASAASLYEVGFNHFFHGATEGHGGDLIYIQGHSAPGIYARSFLEGRITEQQLDNFRQEVDGKGLSSYPHPRLMPDYWQFPTVSMGLGPLQAIYQARYLKYLANRDLLRTENRKVWAFLGDGEMDEPESTGALSFAGREQLDNLIFVVNCNLQRLDGPVRGNGKIIQELEGLFRGAGWNVIKVIWGRYWDPLLAMDTKDILLKVMDETLDGEYQNCKAKGGAYTREHFFGKDPELLSMVSNMTDSDIWRLNRGGHDVTKLYAAYHTAVHHQGQPTVILAKTVKGYGMGASGEGKNITHQLKKMDVDALKMWRDRFALPIKDEDLEKTPYYRPAEDSEEIIYLKQRRAALGGFLPARRRNSKQLPIPALNSKIFEAALKDSGKRQYSTTTAFVRMLNALCKDAKLGPYVTPIVPDEARTFGMEAMFRKQGIYSAKGQLYEPVDSDQVMYYREVKDGQIIQEGINEAGAFSSWMAAASSYSVSNFPMVPFYVFYSMFGFQRIGDLAWAAGDMQARGFLLGATSGRTTLNGEGLQHEDGHSHILAGTIPNCISYDPPFAYELAVIIQDGLCKMYQQQENLYYYITLMNENYIHPAMPIGSEQGIIQGMYALTASPSQTDKTEKSNLTVRLLGSGAIMQEVLAAATLLDKDFHVQAQIWSVTSFNQLSREGRAVERQNRLNPSLSPKQSYVETCLASSTGPVIAATDYIKAYAEQIRAYVSDTYVVLGTDGFGRSDSRANLRRFFEVDRYSIAYTALKALADQGQLSLQIVLEAQSKYGIDGDKTDPICS